MEEFFAGEAAPRNVVRAIVISAALTQFESISSHFGLTEMFGFHELRRLG